MDDPNNTHVRSTISNLVCAKGGGASGLAVEESRFDGGRGIAGAYDLVFAAHVMEHLPDPARFLAGSLGSDPRIRYITVGQGSQRSVT